MSNCVKTGCHIFVEEYGVYARGDAFGIEDNIFYFRLVQESREPIESTLHFRVHKIEDWFDRDPKQVSTLIARSATDLGYDGIPCN